MPTPAEHITEAIRQVQIAKTNIDPAVPADRDTKTLLDLLQRGVEELLRVRELIDELESK